MNFFSNIISGVTNFFTPQAPSVPPVSSFSNPVVTESVTRVRDFVAPMLEKPTFSFAYQPSNVGANRVYSAATAEAPVAPAPRYDEYVAPSIGPVKLPADLKAPLTGSVVNMTVQQRAYDGLGSRMSMLEKAREAGFTPNFDVERLLYDPGAGARYLREAGKVPLLFDYVPISGPGTYLETKATQMGGITRGLRDATAVGYLAPGLPASSSAVGKIGNLTLSGVGYGAALETLNLPWDTPIAERLDKTAAAGVAGGAFGAGLGTAMYGKSAAKELLTPVKDAALDRLVIQQMFGTQSLKTLKKRVPSADIRAVDDLLDSLYYENRYDSMWLPGKIASKKLDDFVFFDKNRLRTRELGSLMSKNRPRDAAAFSELLSSPQADFPGAIPKTIDELSKKHIVTTWLAPGFPREATLRHEVWHGIADNLRLSPGSNVEQFLTGVRPTPNQVPGYLKKLPSVLQDKIYNTLEGAAKERYRRASGEVAARFVGGLAHGDRTPSLRSGLRSMLESDGILASGEPIYKAVIPRGNYDSWIAAASGPQLIIDRILRRYSPKVPAGIPYPELGLTTSYKYGPLSLIVNNSL